MRNAHFNTTHFKVKVLKSLSSLDGQITTTKNAVRAISSEQR